MSAPVDVVLLGAGASIDAGLPGTFDLTTKILDAVALDPTATREARTLQFVAGALLYAEGLTGQNPIKAGIDVEALCRGLDRLEQRTESDVAPFVASWHHAVAEIEALEPRQHSLPNPFAAAKQRVEQELLRLLWKKEGLNVHYLSPLGDVVTRQGALTILSLNYDNVVETFCAAAGLPCSTGVPEEEGFNQSAPYELRWVEKGVNLVKLHGSLLWGRFLKHGGERMGSDRLFVMSYRGNPPDYVGQPHLFPGIVFGGDNKLSPLHPFPDLYATFRNTLREATRLTVVGYSFRDDHVNAGLSAFLSRGEPVTAMTVVNTASDKALPFLKSIGKLADRVRYIRKPAAEGLSEAFR